MDTASKKKDYVVYETPCGRVRVLERQDKSACDVKYRQGTSWVWCVAAAEASMALQLTSLASSSAQSMFSCTSCAVPCAMPQPTAVAPCCCCCRLDERATREAAKALAQDHNAVAALKQQVGPKAKPPQHTPGC
jgi:hypothetical protein